MAMKDTPRAAPTPPGALQLFLLLALAVAVGGTMTYYIWTTVHLLLVGMASGGRIAAGAVAALLLLGLVVGLGCYLGRFAPPGGGAERR